MTKLSRRSVLRALAVTPAVIPALEMQTRMASGGLAGGLQGGPPGLELADAPNNSRKFTDFGAWLKEFGEDVIRREAKQTTGFDADIIDLHLPLATKVRMQRKRNYESIKADRLRNFTWTVMGNGFFRWWT